MLSDDASNLRLMAALVTNLVEAVPVAAYRRSHVRRRLFGRAVTMVAHPDVVRTLLTDDRRFGHASVMKRAFGPISGRGVLASEGPHWHNQRRRATPAFRYDAVMSLLPAMNEAAERAATRWLAADATVDVTKEMMAATLDVIGKALLPPDTAFPAEDFYEALTSYLDQSAWHVGLDLFGLPAWSPYPGRAVGRRTATQCRNMVRQAVEHAPVGQGLLAHLQGEFEGEELVDALTTFIAAGYETTATALSWALWALAIRPVLAVEAAAEANAISGPIGPADLPKLKLTRRIVQETLRLYPPAPVLVRDVREDCVVEGVRFKKGQTVYLPIFALHRHTSAWPEPDRFNPDRFLPEAVQARHRFAYLPFGAGPRVCMGATLAMTEAVVMLAVLMRRIEILPPEGLAPRPVARITLRAAGGVHLRARPWHEHAFSVRGDSPARGDALPRRAGQPSPVTPRTETAVLQPR